MNYDEAIEATVSKAQARRDIAKQPWERDRMKVWLDVMKFEIDTAADDFV